MDQLEQMLRRHWAWIQTAIFVALMIAVAIRVSVWLALGTTAFVVTLEIVLYRPEWLRPGKWVIAIVTVFAVAIPLEGSEARLSFYKSTATVIPVLFIALSLELRRSIASQTDTEMNRSPAVFAIALALAEFESLKAISNHDASGADFGIVTGAMIGAGVALVLSVLLGPDPEVTEEDPMNFYCSKCEAMIEYRDPYVWLKEIDGERVAGSGLHGSELVEDVSAEFHERCYFEAMKADPELPEPR